MWIHNFYLARTAKAEEIAGNGHKTRRLVYEFDELVT
jgi:uncharacterized protein (DUF1330 family)